MNAIVIAGDASSISLKTVCIFNGSGYTIIGIGHNEDCFDY